MQAVIGGECGSAFLIRRHLESLLHTCPESVNCIWCFELDSHFKLGQIHARLALNVMQRHAVRRPAITEQGIGIQRDRVYHKRTVIPLADRVPIERRWKPIGMVSSTSVDDTRERTRLRRVYDD